MFVWSPSGEPDNPNWPRAIHISDVEVLGYYQDQCSTVEIAGLEEAMCVMTIVVPVNR